MISKTKRNFLKFFSFLTLNLYFLSSQSIKYLKNKTFLTVKKRDRNNRLWLGTNSGISISNLSQELTSLRFTNYTIENGLAHNQVRGGIYQDTDGLMWFGTRAGGVCLFDGITWSSLDKRDGIGFNELPSSLMISQDSDGNMWFVWVGLTRYRRSQVKPIVDIVSVQTDRSTYIDAEIMEMNQITAGTRITIQYNAIDFITHPLKRQYRYRLRGIEKLENWSQQTTDANFDYAFKTSGNYTFEVQAINRDLRYSEIASVNFQVVPPWYLNGWIMFSSGGSILAILI